MLFFLSPLAAAAKSLQSCPTLATPWTAAYQAPPSMGFSWQEYWSGVPLPSLTAGASNLEIWAVCSSIYDSIVKWGQNADF